MKLLKWRVGGVPTGRYRSFETRGWPNPEYKDSGRAAGDLTCADEYVPSAVKEGNHKPIKVVVYHYNHPNAGNSWARLKFKVEFKTLKEAKEALENYIIKHPEVMPKKEAL